MPTEAANSPRARLEWIQENERERTEWSKMLSAVLLHVPGRVGPASLSKGSDGGIANVLNATGSGGR